MLTKTFNWFLAALGIVANVLGILSFYLSVNSSSMTLTEDFHIILFHCTYIYMWFVLSWIMATSTIRKRIKLEKKQSDSKIVLPAILSPGLLLLPFYLGYTYYFDLDGGTFFLTPIMFIGIYYGVKSLLVLVHPEYTMFVEKLGAYQCVKSYKSHFSGIQFKKEDTIRVVKKTYSYPEDKFYTDIRYDMYLFNSDTASEAVISKGELLHYFEPI